MPAVLNARQDDLAATAFLGSTLTLLEQRYPFALPFPFENLPAVGVHEGWWTDLDYARSVALDQFQDFFRRGARSATTRYTSAHDHPAVLRGLLEISVACLSAAQAHPLARRHPDQPS